MKNKIMNPISLFAIGVILGILSKLLDLYTQNIGHMFSELSIWILLGVIITLNSKNKKSACMNIFSFCIGMLISYYITAEIANSVYGKSFIIGWTVFSFLSPLFAYITYLTKEKNAFSIFISIGIIAVTLSASIIIFDRPRLYDFIIILILIYILFIKKKRQQ